MITNKFPYKKTKINTLLSKLKVEALSIHKDFSIPFRMTNGVACFQSFIDNSVRSENLNGTLMDDVTVCGKDQHEQDINLKKFLAAVKKFVLTVNDNM